MISWFYTFEILTLFSSFSSSIQTLKQGLFEFYTGYSGMKLADGVNSISMCIIKDALFDLLYLIDLDGSFRPNPSMARSISTVVASDNKMHTTFLDPNKCTDNAIGCYSYCENTCFRSMRYDVQGIDQANYKLKVCLRGDYTKCTLFKGGRRGTSGPHSYIAHLPSGQLYDAVFLNALGLEIAPPSVTKIVEMTLCPANTFDVTLYGSLVK
jgi:hypothetical protein